MAIYLIIEDRFKCKTVFNVWLKTMAGTKASGRPGGNPDFGTKYAFQTEREEPLTENVSLRISASMKSQLKQQKNWQELVRKAIADSLQSA